MVPAVDARTATASLSDTASSTLALLRQFIPILSTSPPNTLPKIVSDSPQPIDVLHTSATLLKAHTTKLSLLILNKPFTPSAIRRIISDVTNTCMPAMMSAVEFCQPQQYGKLLHNEVRMRVRRVFIELESMMVEVMAQTSQDGESEEKYAASGRDSLASTGVVWEACDALIELKTVGTVDLVVKKAQEYRDILEDAISELKEWADSGEEDGEDGEDEAEVSDGGHSIDDMVWPGNSLPKDRADLKDTLTTSLKKLKLVSMLYQALIKRRLKTVEITPWNVTRVDHVMEVLKRIPEQTDELASVFYELDNEGAQKLTREIGDSGKDAVKLMSINWKSENDEFTDWSAKWVQSIDRN